MKKSVKQVSCAQTKFFNEALTEEDLIAPSIITASREDIVLTHSHCSTNNDQFFNRGRNNESKRNV